MYAYSPEVEIHEVDQDLECQYSVGSSTKCAMPKCIFSVKDVADSIVLMRSIGSYQYSQEFRCISPAVLSDVGSDGCLLMRTGTAFLIRRSIGRWPRTGRFKVSSLAGSSSGLLDTVVN